jgi:hypothetical protein
MPSCAAAAPRGRKRIALMRRAGLRGRTPKRWRKTTIPDPGRHHAGRSDPPGLHRRRQQAQRPLVRRHLLHRHLGRLAAPGRDRRRLLARRRLRHGRSPAQRARRRRPGERGRRPPPRPLDALPQRQGAASVVIAGPCSLQAGDEPGAPVIKTSIRLAISLRTIGLGSLPSRSVSAASVRGSSGARSAAISATARRVARVAAGEPRKRFIMHGSGRLDESRGHARPAAVQAPGTEGARVSHVRIRQGRDPRARPGSRAARTGARR